MAKILFTGASSFTGYWFVKELLNLGHNVIATFTKDEASYDGIRLKRVNALKDLKGIKRAFNISFGKEEFLKLLQEEKPEILCHHAADVRNYKSLDFDVVGALASNTEGLLKVVEMFKALGGHKIVYTGSIFEQREGAGSDGLIAFSPYGLSKGLTSEIVEYYATRAKLQFSKFVIPNPFGPFEEARFTAYLVQNWFKKEIPKVATPNYVRDNIHISLLAKAYALFVTSDKPKLSPSGYPESQGSFATRFSAEMKKRLNLDCQLELLEQKEYLEPRVRINTDLIVGSDLGWSEKAAWDELASYYQELYG